jgi:hypothetical protein
MSRIDRIYLNEKLYLYVYNWKHKTLAKLSDYEIVIVDILKKGLPYIGEGLWRLYEDNINNTRFTKRVWVELNKMQKRMEEKVESNEVGIQEMWLKAKDKIKGIAIAERLTRKNEMNKQKDNLRFNVVKKLKQSISGKY